MTFPGCPGLEHELTDVYTDNEKYKHKRVYRSTTSAYGALLQVADPRPSAKTYLNLQQMASLISHICQPQRASHKHDVHELAQSHLASLLVA
jgi:hypothetical protein